MKTHISPKLAEAFDTLLAVSKTHTQAALIVGLSPGHYRKIRHGRVNIPKHIAELIILKAKTVAPQEQPVAQAKLANHDDPGMSLPNSGQSVTV